MLSNTRIKEEITNIKATISKLGKLREDAISGIEINKIVLRAFEEELQNK